MTQFKVGDWVRTPHRGIFQIQHEIELASWEITLGGKAELWQPKEGEWCWFGQRLGRVLDVFTVQGKTKVKSTAEYPVYVMNGKRREFYETRDDWDIDNVEPFIGQLPSWIKENIK